MYLTHKDLSNYEICDIEADSLKPTRLWCAVFINAATREVHKAIGRDEIKRAFEGRRGRIFVGHNFLAYDAPALRRLADVDLPDTRIIDTLVLSYLYHPRLPGGHSLEAWGERFRYPKDMYDDFRSFSPELLARCVVDCELTLTLFLELTRRMRNVGFSEWSCEIEHKVQVLDARQKSYGWFFDIPMAEALRAELRSREVGVQDTIQRVFKPKLHATGTYKYRMRGDGTPYASYQRHLEEYDQLTWNEDRTEYETWKLTDFNIGSPKQRVSRLLEAGWQPTKFTPKKAPQADEDSIVEFARLSGISEVGLIADWLIYNGRANMLDTWLNNVDYEDSRMHGSVFSCGAQSRRKTHSGPNTANVPSNEARFGREARALWTVRDPATRRIVGTDAKSIQMRLFANLLPNSDHGRRYWDTDLCPDPHQENAELIGIARKPVKNVFYANLFGAYPPKLATTSGATGSKQELQARGDWIKGELYRVTPGLEQATQRAEREFNASTLHWMRCPDGGYVRCPSLNAALNYQIQPAEAVVMKVASIIADDEFERIGLDQDKVGDIHDEVQDETSVADAQRVGEVRAWSIQKAGEALNLKVPLAGEFKVGLSWAETH